MTTPRECSVAQARARGAVTPAAARVRRWFLLATLFAGSVFLGRQFLAERALPTKTGVAAVPGEPKEIDAGVLRDLPRPTSMRTLWDRQALMEIVDVESLEALSAKFLHAWEAGKIRSSASALVHLALLERFAGQDRSPGEGKALLALRRLTSADGDAPPVIVNYRAVGRAIRSGGFGESHENQVLATLGWMGVRASSETGTPSVTIRDLVTTTFRRASAESADLEWLIPAVGFYSGPSRSWQNRCGLSMSLDVLVDAIMHRDMQALPCHGTHVLGALALVSQLNAKNAILDKKTAQRVDAHLTDAVARLALQQRASGAWGGDWNEDLALRRVEEDETLRRVTELTVTGHVLEALLAMPDQILVEEGMVRGALAWVTERVRSELNQEAPLRLLCPWTHCICSAHRVARGD